jgi:hypothetical protein
MQYLLAQLVAVVVEQLVEQVVQEEFQQLLVLDLQLFLQQVVVVEDDQVVAVLPLVPLAAAVVVLELMHQMGTQLHLEIIVVAWVVVVLHIRKGSAHRSDKGLPQSGLHPIQGQKSACRHLHSHRW